MVFGPRYSGPIGLPNGHPLSIQFFVCRSITGPARPRPEYTHVGIWQHTKPNTRESVDALIAGVRLGAEAGVDILVTAETSLTGLRPVDPELNDPQLIEPELERFQRAVAEIDVHSGVKTRTGHVHAGALLSLADTTATYLAVASIHGSYFDLTRFPVAIGISSQLIGNVQDGILRAEAALVHGGRTLVVVETRITSGEGRLLATVNSTHFVRDSGGRGGA